MSRRAKGPRLYLRPARGTRQAAYVIRDGTHEVSTGCGPGRLAEAERALSAYLAEKYTPTARPGAGLDDILIADVLAAYLAEHAPHTANPAWIAHTASPVLDWWGSKTLAAVKGQGCRDYVTWRTAQTVRHTTRTVSESTARHELTTLRAAIHHWHREHGPLPSVPAVTLPPGPPPRDRWLTRAEAARLLWTAYKGRQMAHLVRVILIGLYTGTRSTALLSLKWMPSTDAGWIDLEAGVIHRKPAGRRQTKKRQTPVKIPGRLLAHLRRWRRQDLERRRPIVHVIHYGGQPVAKLRRSWARACGIAGLGDDVVPHTLRHTAATWLMQSGIDHYEAGGFLGMSSQMLEDVYGHHHPDFQGRAANALRRRTGEERSPDKPRKPTSRSGNERQ